MGREVLLAALGWLSISGVLAVNNFAFKDQEGAESASRLYRHAPEAVYASAAPYGAYSFQIPTISVQKPAASKIVPVKESYQNANGYLQDSYGNRFVEALQSMKTLPLKPFPQQYVQLQELPAHFAQPLAAAPAHYHAHHKQAPQVFVGSHYRLPSPAQSPAAPVPTPLNQQFSFPHSGVYADTFKNLAPAAFSFGPHFGSVIHVPVRSVAPARDSHNNAQPSQDFSHSVSEKEKHPSAQQQSTSHKAVYADVQPQQERYHDHHLKGEHKFQRFQEAPQEVSHETYSEEEPPAPARQVAQKLTTKQIVSAVKETPIPAVVNGKKTVVNVKTKPPLPLLDISLLEPLTFANPLVPQVQHFLPRISEATYLKLPELEKHEDKKYQKEYVVQKTKTYGSGIIKGKPKKPKKKQKVPEVEHHSYDDDDYIPAATARPTVTIKNIDESPEISYEINSPNYKETYKEQAVKYNKETNSEPVHYTYGTKTQKEPVHYSYTHSSKEPVHIKEVHYEGKGEGPKHLIYNTKPDDYNKESEKSKPESEHSQDDVPQRSHHSGHVKHHTHRQETPTSSHHHEPEHREQEHHHNPHSDTNHNVHREQEHQHHHHREQDEHRNPHSDTHHNVHREQEHRHNPHSDTHHNVHREQEHRHNPHSDTHHNVHKEQEHRHNPHSDTHHNVHREQEHQRHNHHTDAHHNDHREQEHRHNPHTDTRHNEQKYHKPSSDTHYNGQHSNNHQPHSVDVIPFQYEEDIHLPAPIKVDPNQHIQQQPQPSPAPHQHSRLNYTPQHHSKTDIPQHETPSTHVHEKTKQVYIQEETPEEDDTVGEQVSKSMFGKEEDKEQDFENAYKNAAFGFPAYDKSGKDVEKDIYNPESYGIPHDHSTYNIDHSPFQQYQEQGDNFPKEMRINYQDDRNKLKEDYFLDYSVSKPESLVDRYKNKVNYYKLFKDQKPEKYTYAPHEDDRNKQKQSAKLTAIPYSYYPVQGDMKQFFAQYKAAPFMFEYDYSKGTPKPKDNSAHASRPFQRLMNTQFVEPQFQYGFEPIAIPRLLDSELAAMATNNFPKSEKPGTRKKIYKENFYIKKTSMSDAVPNS